MSDVKLQGEKIILREECHVVEIDYSMGGLTVRCWHECDDADPLVLVSISSFDDGGLRALEKLEAFAQGCIMDEHLNRSGVDF